MQNLRNLVVVGNGMVGHKLIDVLVNRGANETYQITTFCEESRVAYDRVNLSKFFDGKTAEDLSLVAPGFYERHRVNVRCGEKAVKIDREAKEVLSSTGERVPYDVLVLATGSFPFVPPIEGKDGPGCFVYRTIDDLEALSAYSQTSKTGVVIGGGLLGLEAANAVMNMGLQTHVVEFAPRLMTLQVDDVGGALLRQKIESLGVKVHTNKNTSRIERNEAGAVCRMHFVDGSSLETDMIVFSAGIRPRDELARDAGLSVGPRGGIVVTETCQTSDPNIYAVGECALYDGRIFGLVAPGYKMAEVAALQILEQASEKDRFLGFDMSTKLKLMGVDVGSFGDAFAKTPGAHVISFYDSVASIYKKLVLSEDRKFLLGGMLIGDASSYSQLLALVQAQVALPGAAEELILPARSGEAPAGMGPEHLPEGAIICSCHNVTKGAICGAITTQGLSTVSDVKGCTKAGTGCGSCVTLLAPLLKAELAKTGVVMDNRICEHFKFTRQELFHLVKVNKLKSFDALIAAHGQGLGCEICKPAVASILASTWNEHILESSHVGLQDSNDRFLANVQRDGTYSVVPRVAGGEITPKQLIALGQVAEEYNLYCKITGGQRVDLFGARVEELPGIWEKLIAAGFESGHAYGKALRTVKSCVGSTWCRYGVQDSVGLAIRIENRYKGLRSPHKLKSAVSGCARECAEAQSKDFGIIATEKGYNLYVCGNGGMKPQHAQLLASDLDEDTLIKYVDRFLMFYVRTADRLQRTATWFNNLEGGMKYLKQVIVEDSLGLAAELEAEMQHLVDTYQCEWKTAVEDPQKRKMFRSFVNSDAPDPSIMFVKEREQHRPAFWDEKERLVPLRKRASAG
ncbi:MAG: nitrite reductase large subunit NirB [Deltaproteobacteria bacterium]|nr:nitrite reductase large subunit NirB [Deltaproteobacteria bacterium]